MVSRCKERRVLRSLRGTSFINAHEAILMANRLHRWVLAAALTGLAGGVLAQTGSSSVSATPAPAGGPGWHQHRHHGGYMGFIMHSFHDLDLTAAQKEQMHTIMSAARQQHSAERAAGGATMMALADPGNANYASALATAKQHSQERIQEGSDLQLKLYAILTPAQKAQLTQNVAAHEAKMQQWKAAHAAGAGSAGTN
jgi:Spy/CpxP family protein refolding chaperone